MLREANGTLGKQGLFKYPPPYTHSLHVPPPSPSVCRYLLPAPNPRRPALWHPFAMLSNSSRCFLSRHAGQLGPSASFLV